MRDLARLGSVEELPHPDASIASSPSAGQTSDWTSFLTESSVISERSSRPRTTDSTVPLGRRRRRWKKRPSRCQSPHVSAVKDHAKGTTRAANLDNRAAYTYAHDCIFSVVGYPHGCSVKDNARRVVAYCKRAHRLFLRRSKRHLSLPHPRPRTPTAPVPNIISAEGSGTGVIAPRISPPPN